MGTTKGAIVASRDAALASLRELRRRKIHRHFAGYLCVLRTAAQTSSRSNLQVNFRQFFEDFLRPGEVPEKTPYFVPFSRSESASADLSIANVAGSYAPSSLRADRPFSQVVTVSGQKNTARYTLPDDHWRRALEHLAFGEKVPLVPLAIYLYRDYAIEVATGDFRDFATVFGGEFGLEEGDGAEPWRDLFEVDGSYLDGLELGEPTAFPDEAS